MIKRIITNEEKYIHGTIYSFRKFAWFPIKVTDITTGYKYRVWFDHYYQNWTAISCYTGRMELHHDNGQNKLPSGEWNTLQEHPANGLIYSTYTFNMLNKPESKVLSEESLMRQEIAKALNEE
jgi:hypothetical protein